MKNKRAPEIRIGGFNEDWEHRELGDISEKITEKNKDNKYSETLTNSAEFGIVTQRDFFEKDISNKKNLGGYYVVHPDYFVYNPRISNFAPVGPIKRNKLGRTGVMSPLYYVFRTHDVDKMYLEYYFSGNGWYRFMNLNGDSGARSDRFAIKDSVFRQMPIPIPSTEEQVEIGNFFTELEEIIYIYQQELDTLKQTKQGFLQKMFPKDKETEPTVRFKGFSKAWCELKLGEIGEFKTSSVNKVIEDGEHFVHLLNYMDVYNQRHVDAGTVNKLMTTTAKANQIENNNLLKNDILFTPSSETPEDIGHSMVITEDLPNTVYSYHLVRFRPNIILDAAYSNIFANITPVRQQIVQKATGSTRFTVSLKDFNDIIVKFPSIEEQQKIGNFFKQLDDTIALHEIELETLKQTKKAFLQKMFV